MSNEFKPLMVWCYTCSSMVQPTARMRGDRVLSMERREC
jgi:hypothetical protein